MMRLVSPQNDDPCVLHVSPKIIVMLIAIVSLSFGMAVAEQGSGEESKQVNEAMARLRAGDDTEVTDALTLAKAKAVVAIPGLEERFRRMQKPELKQEVAFALLELRDPNEVYWNYVLEQVRPALEEDIPNPSYTERGGTAELQDWASRHGMEAEKANRYALREYPFMVPRLAVVGDPRALPYLRRALRSRNHLIIVFAPKGLAQLHDTESIPPIISAVEAAPADVASLIAEALVFFDDARAQKTADQYMERDKAAMFREQRAKGMGVFGWR